MVITIGLGWVRIVSERLDVAATLLLLSATFTTNVNVPAEVGVPLSMPVPAPSERPGGSDPDAMDHTNGAVPPLTVNVSCG